MHGKHEVAGSTPARGSRIILPACILGGLLYVRMADKKTAPVIY